MNPEDSRKTVCLVEEIILLPDFPVLWDKKKKNPKTQKLCAKKPFMLIIGQPAVSRTMVLEFEWASESPGGFVKAQMVPPFP